MPWTLPTYLTLHDRSSQDNCSEMGSVRKLRMSPHSHAYMFHVGNNRIFLVACTMCCNRLFCWVSGLGQHSNILEKRELVGGVMFDCSSAM